MNKKLPRLNKEKMSDLTQSFENSQIWRKKMSNLLQSFQRAFNLPPFNNPASERRKERRKDHHGKYLGTRELNLIQCNKAFRRSESKNGLCYFSRSFVFRKQRRIFPVVPFVDKDRFGRLQSQAEWPDLGGSIVTKKPESGHSTTAGP